MGKRIDAFLGLTLLGGLLFLFFCQAFDSPLAAGTVAFLCGAMLKKLSEGLRARLPESPGRRKRRLRRRAADLLERWARLPEEEAVAEIRRALDALYPDEALETAEVAALLYPAACPPASSGACFDIWRQRQGQARLVIVCTGRAGAEAFAWARTADAPRVCLLDSERLIPALARCPDLLPESRVQPHAGRRRPALPHIPRSRLPRCALTGSGLILTYAVTGRPFYLIAGLGLLLAVGLGLKRPPEPRRLFGGVR